MSRPRKWPPSIHKHHSSGQAFVRIAGRDHYLGPHGSAKAKERYARLVAEIAAAGSAAPPSPAAALTVAELAVRYLAHLERLPRPQGDSTTNEYLETRRALIPVLTAYGSLPAADFGTRCLKAIRQMMRDGGLKVTTANNRVGRVRRMFRWGAEEELVPGAIWATLRAVKRLPQPAARPEPVALEVVEATLDELRPVVADLVRVQLLTGARPGEVVILRPGDIDRSGDVWIYRPAHHKTTYKGIDRLILIGPQAQAVLLPYLARPADAYCFVPGIPRGRHVGKARGKRYRVPSYASAVRRACRRAFPHPALVEIDAQPLPAREKGRLRRVWKAAHSDELKAWERAHHWHPHRLRHAAATRFRESFGLEGAQAMLGHERAATTEIYALLPPVAYEIARKIG